MSSIANTIVVQAQAMGIDASLALAVAQVESGLNQNAVSPAGAIGVFQLMPSTAVQLGVEPADLQQNIIGGITYLKQMLSQFGDVTAALAAYDCGPGCVRSLQAQYGSNWLAHAPAETQNYVPKVLAIMPVPPPMTSGGGPTNALAASNGGTLQIPIDLGQPASLAPGETFDITIELLPIAALLVGGIVLIKLL